MQNLKRLLEMLQQKKVENKKTYYIPELWNSFGYGEFSLNETRKGEICVNPYDFIISCIEKNILSEEGSTNRTYSSIENYNPEKDLGKSVMYSMLPRMFTAWKHYDEDRLCSGTFLKSICLLPYLKSMNIDIIYLLPVFEYSDKYKKGELGSPYAIKNIYKLSGELHDELLGENTGDIVELEFKAFIEACHVLGIKVMVDFVFRTVSRDNDLIVTHPDWFYWIESKHNMAFGTPVVEKEKEHTLVSDKTIKSLYTCKGIKDHLAKFAHSPKTINPELWEKVVGTHKTTGENILDLIEKEFGITTVPGFADVINDPQPPWTDVTYLKYCYDIHEKVRKYIDKTQPPYILQDGVKLSMYCGTELNKDLYEYVAGVIPYYQEKFRIDGARIDMGHALPTELNKEIIARTKAVNKNFILWSEEFSPDNSRAAREDGFHFITGDLWHFYKTVEKEGFSKKLIDTLMKSEIPATGALETADTPRAALAYNTKSKIETMILINCFVPNVVPLINNGMDVMEVQPMNLGLDNTEEGKYILEESDPMFGKLAFFDNYCIHWNNSEKNWMTDLLSKSFGLRSKFSDIISKRENFIKECSFVKNPKLIVLCYFDVASKKGLLFLANKDFSKKAKIRIADVLPDNMKNGYKVFNSVYEKGALSSNACDINKTRTLETGEVIINYVEI